MNTPLVVLGILDGFGYSPQQEGNAIVDANTPNLDRLWSQYPHLLLKAAEEEVGLAFGEVGNSEVGHITIGSGRVIPQSLSLINKAIDDGSFFTNKAFTDVINQVKLNGTAMHLYGIISTAGVHGHLFHYINLIKLAAQMGLTKVYLHLITDGRDSGSKYTPLFLREINKVIKETGVGTYATIIGRGLAMDRNENWELTKQGYDLLFGTAVYRFPTPEAALEYYYSQGHDDESIPPSVLGPDGNPPVISENDGIIITNFREDRARQITKSLALPAFHGFERTKQPNRLFIATMTSYEKALPVQVAFPPPPIYNTLSDIFSKNQVPQIHIAETEKYAHVTYFLNGGREQKAPYEEYFMVKSIKPDQFTSQPEMSAPGVSAAVVSSIQQGYRFIVFNLANADMVGHTGDYQATIKAIETLDTQVQLIWQAVEQAGGSLFITADHGNSEQMLNPKTQAIFKKHTISPVPFIVANTASKDESIPVVKIMSDGELNGLLSDIAPTLLSVAGLPIPAEMTGASLLG